MTGIIGAMDVEVAAIKAAMQHTTQTVISGIPFTAGTLYDHEVILARCGIGKVNAAVCAQIMISVFGVTELINTGVAGAVAHGIRQNDIVIAKNFVQHDVDTSAIGDPVGFVSTVNQIYFEADPVIAARLKDAIGEKAHCVTGTIATGDRFVADRTVTAALRERFNAAACDMEGGAIAHVCTLAGIPFGAVRCISDSADENAVMDYPTFAAAAADTCAAMVLSYMAHLSCAF
ncbi:MAG: 5'-methylthioadenosine/adenosylhomocysteine nucleosidase [Clostridia bacterium]|nr:5'-methylthioadenosine/adenosylhomocysteine nucleosidase [Clostridia bacterium]